MEKSRMRPVTSGKSVRMSYSRQKEVLEMPNLIEIQKDSYQWFLDFFCRKCYTFRTGVSCYTKEPNGGIAQCILF